MFGVGVEQRIVQVSFLMFFSVTLQLADPFCLKAQCLNKDHI